MRRTEAWVTLRSYPRPSPTQRESDECMVQLEKLLSETIRHDGLDAIGAPRKDKYDQNLGALSRLAPFLEGKAYTGPL